MAVDQLAAVRNLIADVKSRRSIFERNLDVLQRRRDLKDVCDWAESMTTDSSDPHTSRARRLVWEKLKDAQQHVQKNVEDKLAEIQELKRRQMAMNFKDPKKPKYVNAANSRLLHQKQPICERCTKKRSQEKPVVQVKPKERFPAPASATTRRPKGPSTSKITSHKVNVIRPTSAAAICPFIPHSVVSRRTVRASTSNERQLAQTLKEKLRISCQIPKVTLLGVTQKNNVPTSTKATNTGATNYVIGGVETMVHADVDTRWPVSRALSIRLLPGVSVPATIEPAESPSLVYESPSRSNVGHLDVWSAAEVGLGDYDDIRPERSLESGVFRPASSSSSMESAIPLDDDHWLATTRQWLERRLVRYVLSELRLQESPNFRDDGVDQSLAAAITSQFKVQSGSSSESTEDVEVEQYTDTFESSEILENSVPKTMSSSSVGPSANGILSQSVLENNREDLVDASLRREQVNFERTLDSTLNSLSGHSRKSGESLMQDQFKETLVRKSSDTFTQESRDSLGQEAEGSIRQSSISSGTWTRVSKNSERPSDNLEDIVSSSRSSRSRLLVNIPLEPVKAMDHQSTVQEFEITKQYSEIAKQDFETPRQDSEIAKQHFEITKQDSEIDKQAFETPQQDSEIAKQDFEITKQDFEITKQDSDIVKQHFEIVKQDLEIAKQEFETPQQGVEMIKQQAFNPVAFILNENGEIEHIKPPETCLRSQKSVQEPPDSFGVITEVDVGPTRDCISVKKKKEFNSPKEFNLPEAAMHEMPRADQDPRAASPAISCKGQSEGQHGSARFGRTEQVVREMSELRHEFRTQSETSATDTSGALSTLADEDDTLLSIGQIMSTRKLRHVAFNRMKRKKAKMAEVTPQSEQSVASTLDGTEDLDTDSDVWAVSSSTIWSEGEVRLDPLLGAILKRTSVSREEGSMSRASPGEVRVPNQVSLETTLDIDVDKDNSESPTSDNNHSLGELESR